MPLIIYDKNHCNLVDASQRPAVTLRYSVTVISKQALAARYKLGTVMVIGACLHQK